MRSTWTDARLDDLNGRVGEIGAEVRRQGDRIDSLQNILLVGGGLFAALIGPIAAMLGVLVTQL